VAPIPNQHRAHEPTVSASGRGRLSRRTLLRAAGAGIALPLLDCMQPRVSRAATPAPPRRLMAIHLESGLMPQFFFPQQSAAGPSSPYLDLIADHRGQFTVFSGMSHPNLGAGHEATNCFLTGAPNPLAKNFRNTQSLDQFAAERIGHETRFPSLHVSVQNSGALSDILAVSRSGVPIPAETSPQRLYRSLFVEGTAAEKAATLRRIEAGGSVLDLVLDKASRLNRTASARDRIRLDQYFSSVRDLEERLARSREWEQRAKPVVDYPEPTDIDDRNQVVEKARLMSDLLRLALQTDSTRCITFYISTFHVVPHVPGVSNETHGLTHHGNEPGKIAELRRIEEAQMGVLGHLLHSLRNVDEQGSPLLDQTMVLFGSGLGSANSHSSVNLPLILAGGGFRHPGHLAFDQQHNEPLANLFVTMLTRMGIETDSFSSSTGSLRGLDA
jgi:hypothetical protein